MAKTRKRPRHFILDGSVAMAWFFKDESSPYADRVAGSFSTWRAVVPAIWHLEIANAVLMGERRGRSTEAQASRWFTYLRSLPVALDEETNQRAWGDVLHLGRAHRLSAYDAAYLELAVRRGLELASLDDKLKAAASALGVALFTP